MTAVARDPEPLLSVEGLTVRLTRGGEHGPALVDDVSLDVGRGEIVCLVGESGSGKSVTARTIMGLTQLDRSLAVDLRMRFAGESIDGPARAAALRGRELAMVFQEPMSSLDPLFTIESQLAESLRRRHGRLPRAERRARMLRLLADVGIHDGERVLRSHPHELSGGMCQRVMIASALACEPDLLIADEPTTALDVTVQAQILELIDRLRAERGMAVLLVTHDMGVAAEVADRVVMMYSGRVVEEASPGEAFFDARHPYTRGLLACIPPMTGERAARLSAIPGMVPDPAHRPRGCPFSPRCELADDRCREEDPALTQERGRRYACWNPIGVKTPDVAGATP
ncbi:ABC transporter ATP-binding protein [Microbacterium marinilacus]|uniref:ABC transporter ATP-binding protein n=1 Tax=Microbacterium marinilacus TaxID=415209 RepID=A0ABP7BRB9_9MICO|nr:ABC transporter ATP-binding protein [Microbacterium marinilacus]MBY0690246.1 ABC transporter ATP-binding protein [Microbacterium marinilacus]